MNDNHPLPRWEHNPINVCVDCYMFTATGETPNDRPKIHEEIQKHYPALDGWQLELGDPESEIIFSWFPCETCGSTLGGSRYELIAMRRIDT